MAFDVRLSNKPFLGNHASEAAALAFVQAEKLDTNGDGTGVVPDGAWFYDTTTTTHKFRQNATWTSGGTSDHGALTGLGDDDHTQYLRTDGTRALTGDQSAGGNKITNLGSPTAGTDAANKAYVDQVAAGLDWQDSVKDKDLTAPPGSPATGDRYIVAATATGAWAGQEEKIAEWDGATWVFTTPNEGFATTVEDENVQYVYTDAHPAGSWVKFGTLVNHNDLAGLQGGTASQYYHLTSTQHSDLTGGSNASSQHIHDDRYFTETELGSTTPGSEGAALIGTDTKTNLNSATTVEVALTDLNDKNPTAFQSGAGTPIGSVTPKMIGAFYLNTNNNLLYRAIGLTSANWKVACA